MSRLNNVILIVHPQLKFQLKNEFSTYTWSRGLSTKPSQNVRSSDQGPSKILQQKIEADELKTDEHQRNVMNELQQLYHEIQTYSPPEFRKKSSLLQWLPINRAKGNVPKGLYIYGSVGGGKTTLMDIFYSSCQSVSQEKNYQFQVMILMLLFFCP